MRIVALLLSLSLAAPQARSAGAPPRSLYHNAELALGKGDYADARRNLEILIQRYPDTEWAHKGRRLLQTQLGEESVPAPIEADEPFVPALPSASPDEALSRLRAAIDADRTEDALAEAYDYKRRYPSSPDSAEVNLAAGALHLRRGESAKAVRILRPLINHPDPGIRGRALHLIGAAMAALGHYEETLRVVPETDAAATGERWLALAQVWRAAAEERLGRGEEAAEHYRALSASGLDSPVRAYALAAIAADWDRRGKADRALDALKRAETEAAKWGLIELRESAALCGAHMLMRLRKFDEAAKAYAGFAERFSQSPLQAQALYQRGLCLKKLNRADEAAAAFETLADKHPASAYAADAHLQLGQLHTELGNSERALVHYRLMAQTSDAQDADREALLLMAQVHYNKKNWSQAVPLYRKYLKGAAPGAKTKEVEGLLLTAAWQADSNDPELPALAARCPDHPLVARIRWGLAANAYKRGDWAGAEDMFRRHIENNPHAANLGEARFYRAESLRQLDRTQDAAGAYRHFLSEHKEHPRASEAAMRLGSLLDAGGDLTGAIAAYGRATGAAERLKSLYAIGRVHERLKSAKEAKAAYERLKSVSPKDDPVRLSGLLRLGLMLELEDKPKGAGPLYAEVLKYAERGSPTFETARKRLESLSGDKSLIQR